MKLKSIKKIGKMPTRCINVENPNGLYVTDDGIVTHNSLMTVLINVYLAIHFAMMWHPYRFFGQSQPLDAKVFITPYNYKRMKDVRIGDEILAPNDKRVKVVGIKDWHNDKVYEFILASGKKVQSGENHLWPVKVDNEEKIVTTKWIVENNNKQIKLLEYNKNNYRNILSIDYLGEKDTRCITVDSKDGLYVTNGRMITHNSPMTIYTFTYCGWSLTKASELLLEPMMQLLEASPYFKKIRTHSEMVDIAKDDEMEDHMCWTSASKTSAISIQNGANFKIISNPGGLLGQSQPMDSKIYLPDGTYKLMKDVKVGDKIASPTEGEQTVLGVFPKGKKKTFKITLTDGRVVRCSDDHLWKVSWEKVNGKRKWEVKPLKFILEHPELDFEIWDKDCNDDLEYIWKQGLV